MGPPLGGGDATRRSIPRIAEHDPRRVGRWRRSVFNQLTRADALRLRGEVHALEEGLEAGVGADGVGDK